MHIPNVRQLAHMALIYTGAIIAGWCFARLRVPLPWMIGPMLFAGIISIAGYVIRVPAITRPMGQSLIAGSVGLAFTPAALGYLLEQTIPMICAAAMTLAAGFLAAILLRRLSRTDTITASLACIPTGPVESAHLASHYNVPVGPVVFGQTLRISLVVLLIPPILVWFDPSNADPSAALAVRDWHVPGIILMLAMAVAGSFLFKRLGISNPFFLGSLSGTALGTLIGLPLSALPFAIIAAAQVLLGVWLGAAFNRELIRRAGSFIPAAFAATLLLLSLCALTALTLSYVTGVPLNALVLSTAPGSVTEMSLTAKILHIDPVLVTAFHIVRIFMIIPFAPLIFAVVDRISRSREPADIPVPKSPETADAPAPDMD